VGTFEVYNNTDRKDDGLYVREKDKLEFAISISKSVNNQIYSEVLLQDQLW
jgi:hypothetical protein